MMTRIFNAATLCLGLALLLALGSTTVKADDWTMTMTVDNQYDVYFGDSLLTVPNFAGGDTSWFAPADTWNITGVSSTAFLYVATASDHSTAQGFLGTFTNLTTGDVYDTSDDSTSPWEVFPAGQYLTQLNANDPLLFPTTVWTASLQPTSPQVQAAVAYATNNNLWVDPVSAPGYNNGSAPLPWGVTFAGIPNSAEWIWHDTGTGPGAPYPAPFTGYNHDEFLVFRVPGVAVPEPASVTISLVGLGLLGLLRRNRCDVHV